jgi:hypothetical protein
MGNIAETGCEPYLMELKIKTNINSRTSFTMEAGYLLYRELFSYVHASVISGQMEC